MRRIVMIGVLTAAGADCAIAGPGARAATHAYVCPTGEIDGVRGAGGLELHVGRAIARDLGHATDGEHFLLLHDGAVLEYVLPDDPGGDVVVRGRHLGVIARCVARERVKIA